MDSPTLGAFCTKLPCTYIDDVGRKRTEFMPVYIMPAAPKRAVCCETGLHRAVFGSMARAYDQYRYLHDDMEASTIWPPHGPVECSAMGRVQMGTVLSSQTVPSENVGLPLPDIRYLEDENIERIEKRPTCVKPDREFERVVQMMQNSAIAASQRWQEAARRARSPVLDTDEPPPYLVESSGFKETEGSELQNLGQGHLERGSNHASMRLAFQSKLPEDPMPCQQTDSGLVPKHCEQLAASPVPMTCSEEYVSGAVRQYESSVPPYAAMSTESAARVGTSGSWIHASGATGVSFSRVADPGSCSCGATERGETHLPSCSSRDEVAA